MIVYLIFAVILLLVVTAVLCILLFSMRRERLKEISGKVILKGGKSVNTEVIRENMGNGILNEHAEESLPTVLSKRLPAGARHVLELADCETGYVYQAVFQNEIVIGSMPDKGRNGLAICITGISRSHCRIYYQEGCYAIEDVGSTNHTWLNGFLLDKPFLIYTDDILQLAQRKFRVTIHAEAG